MSLIISYLAREGDDLQATHTENVQYDIDTGYSSFKAKTPKHVNKNQTALTGRMVSIHHRAERSYSFYFDKMHRDSLADWEEFRDSTRFGAASPFSIDASSVVGVEEQLDNLVISGTPEFEQIGTGDYFTVSFKCYRQPS